MDPICWTALHDAAPQLCSSQCLDHPCHLASLRKELGIFLGTLDRNIAVWFKSLTSVTSEKSGSKSHWCAQSKPGRHLFRCAPVGTLKSFCQKSQRYSQHRTQWPSWFETATYLTSPELMDGPPFEVLPSSVSLSERHFLGAICFVTFKKNLSKWTSPTHLTKKHGVLVVFEGEASEEWIEWRSFHTCEMRGATTARDAISITTSSEKLRLLLSPIPVLGPLLPELFFLACCGARNLLRKGERAGNFCGVCCPILSF